MLGPTDPRNVERPAVAEWGGALAALAVVLVVGAGVLGVAYWVLTVR